MDPIFPSQTSNGSRVFRGACGLLGVVALAQGVAFAMSWKGPVPVTEVGAGVVGKPGEMAAPGKAATAGKSGTAADKTTSAISDDPFAPGMVDLKDPHPELAGPVGDEPAFPDPAEPVIARAPTLIAAPLDVPITDEVCLGHLDEGIYLRDRGDMVGAVAELRKALALAPEHPKLLYQLAGALDGLGQEHKAAVLWRQLRLLGQDAGNYYQLAVDRLKESGGVAGKREAEAEAAEEDKEGRFEITGVKAEHLPGAVQGEIVKISGSIDRKQSEAADVSKVDIKLHLFDVVNGQKIDRTTALPPVIEWLDAPVDWAEGGERFSFEYRQAPLSPDELLKLGQRKYYG
ncbi:MAG: hypothetical protein JWL81_655, partial [Verrucomicrobiales bacterium]|nr:hypothetical protein [Verrucomicrobiales bacterium]